MTSSAPHRALWGLALGLGLVACASRRPEAEAELLLAQRLPLLAPAKAGATAVYRLHGPDMEGALWKLTEVKRQADGEGWRLLMRQRVVDASGHEHEGAGTEWFFHFLPDRLAWGIKDEPEPVVALLPLRLGAPPAQPNLASLSAVQALDLPYGRLPWAAALRHVGPQGDRVATSWFAPGLGLVKHESQARGEALESAELAVWLLP